MALKQFLHRKHDTVYEEPCLIFFSSLERGFILIYPFLIAVSWTCKYCKWLSNTHLLADQMKGHFFHTWRPDVVHTALKGILESRYWRKKKKKVCLIIQRGLNLRRSQCVLHCWVKCMGHCAVSQEVLPRVLIIGDLFLGEGWVYHQHCYNVLLWQDVKLILQLIPFKT